MHPTRTLSALMLALVAGCSSTAQPNSTGMPPDTVAPAAPAAAPAPPAAVDSQPTTPPGASPADAVITAEGAPLLSAPTTAREAQSGDAVTRCMRLSGLFLEDVGRMLRFLGATEAQTRFTVEQLRPFYGPSFETHCVTATPEVLTCVETADNAFTGLARCGLNQGRAFADRLTLRPAVFDVPWNVAEREVRDTAAAEALRAALIGSWDHDGRETWVFTADGGVTRTIARTSGESLVNAYRFTATSGSRFFTTMADGGNGGAPLGFDSAVIAGDTLYLTTGPDGYAQPIAERGPTLATERGYWLIQDLRGTPRCTGFHLVGQPVQSARCAWEGEGDERRLQITAAFGHDLETGEPRPDITLRFREMAGHLVSADRGNRFFTRTAQGGTAQGGTAQGGALPTP